MRKHDVIVAKNYLTKDEIDTLNRLVVIFLDQAELRAKDGKTLTLDFWRSNLDRLMQFNDRPVLSSAGSISHEKMKSIAEERYLEFDEKRRAAEALEAEHEDIKALEDAEMKLVKKTEGEK